jgi:hypothetical protein
MPESKPARRLRRGPVARATIAELADLGVSPNAVAAAAAAVRLATEMDSASDSREAAAAGRELRQAMAVARGLAKPKGLGGKVDELAGKRADRLKGEERLG